MTQQQTTHIHSPTFRSTGDEMLTLLQKGFGHRSPYDAPLIHAAAHSIWQAGRNAKIILEVCCGHGDLLAGLAATFPEASVTGMDQFVGTVKIAAERIKGLPNARVKAADVMHLDEWDDNSVDLIVGQATLHHLSHNPDAAIDEFARVLRPGGICMFTFEPLSHNYFVNAVRSYRNAKYLFEDESNLYIDILERLASKFTSAEVQCFNLSWSYLLKAFPRSAVLLHLGSGLRKLDELRFKLWPQTLRKAANFNVVFTK